MLFLDTNILNEISLEGLFEVSPVLLSSHLKCR